MSMIELILKLLTDEQLIDLFNKITREMHVVSWPPPPEEEGREKEGHLRQLHGKFLSEGFDRGLGTALVEGDEHVRMTLKSLAAKNGGLLPSA